MGKACATLLCQVITQRAAKYKGNLTKYWAQHTVDECPMQGDQKYSSGFALSYKILSNDKPEYSFNLHRKRFNCTSVLWFTFTFVSLTIDIFGYFYSSLQFFHLCYLSFWISLELQVKINNIITKNEVEPTVCVKQYLLLNLSITV